MGRGVAGWFDLGCANGGAFVTRCTDVSYLSAGYSASQIRPILSSRPMFLGFKYNGTLAKFNFQCIARSDN